MDVLDRLCPTVKPICMALLFTYLAKNEDACTLVGGWAPRRSYFLRQLGTIRCVIFALWPHAVRVQPREHAGVLLWQHRVIIAALSVFGWHVHLHSVPEWNAYLNV